MWHRSSDVSLQALGRLVLYVLTEGWKPLQKVGIKDLDPNSPDYSEAVDLVESLFSSDGRDLEELGRHPYFWSNQSRFNFLKSVWNQIKSIPNRRSIFQGPNASKKRFPYPKWTKMINKKILHAMENPKNAKPTKYGNDVTELVRIMRNLDEHKDEEISSMIGDYAEYFLEVFPELTIYVYNSLRQNPTYSHIADFQDLSL